MEMEVTQEQYKQLKEIALEKNMTLDEAFEYVMLLGLTVMLEKEESQ
jgi:hypothetical protein